MDDEAQNLLSDGKLIGTFNRTGRKNFITQHQADSISADRLMFFTPKTFPPYKLFRNFNRNRRILLYEGNFGN